MNSPMIFDKKGKGHTVTNHHRKASGRIQYPFMMRIHQTEKGPQSTPADNKILNYSMNNKSLKIDIGVQPENQKSKATKPLEKSYQGRATTD